LLLSDSRVNPTANNNYALHRACINGHTEAVKLLLEDGRIDPTANNNYPIRIVSSKGYTEIFKLLLADSRTSLDMTVDTDT